MDRIGALEIPEDEAELRGLLDAGRLGERNAIDLKRQIGTSDGAKKDLARDLASLALEGGILVIGVDEGPPATLAAQPVADVKERIGHVARDRVQPPLRIDVREFLATASSDNGYVVVIVPASPDAPHYAEGSYWGRSSAGKVVLRHDEIERRRASRDAHHASIEALLDAEVKQDPTPDALRRHAHVFVVAEPVLGPPGVLDAKLSNSWARRLHEVLVNRMVGIARWSPDIRDAYAASVVPEGYSLALGQRMADELPEGVTEDSLLEMRVTLDGGVRIFCGRGSDTTMRGQRVAMEAIIQGLAARAVQAAAVIAKETDFRGDWDIGLAVTNLRGAVSSMVTSNMLYAVRAQPYPAEGHRETLRIGAGELADPVAVARRLTDRMDRVLNERRFDITSRR